MNTRCILLSLIFISAVAAVGHAGATLYVAPNGSHTYPFATWAAAATNIQLAVDAALDGDTLIVSNGVYRGYGAQLSGSNVVAINKLITMTSLAGAGATIIDGDGALRCLYVRDGVLVRGFTLQNGLAGNGGGVYCFNGGNLDNCTITRSTATLGGGVYFDHGGLVTNCVLTGNAAANGGGGGWRLLQLQQRDAGEFLRGIQHGAIRRWRGLRVRRRCAGMYDRVEHGQ